MNEEISPEEGEFAQGLAFACSALAFIIGTVIWINVGETYFMSENTNDLVNILFILSYLLVLYIAKWSYKYILKKWMDN